MFKVLGMDVVAATRSGKKASVGGFLIEGTGDHHGGERFSVFALILPGFVR